MTNLELRSNHGERRERERAQMQVFHENTNITAGSTSSSHIMQIIRPLIFSSQIIYTLYISL